MYLDYGIEGDELDKRMGGGLYVGQVMSIMGESGEGKSMLSLRLAYGLIQNGASICYISSMFPVREFISESESLGYPLLNDILSDQMSLITSVFLLRRSRKATIDQLLENEKVKQKQVLIIDSLLPIMFTDFDVDYFLTRLRKFSEGRIVIITLNPTDFDPKMLLKIQQLSTTVISLKSKELAGERKRVIELTKFPMAMKAFQQSISYRIEPGRGLIVEISSVS